MSVQHYFLTIILSISTSAISLVFTLSSQGNPIQRSTPSLPIALNFYKELFEGVESMEGELFLDLEPGNWDTHIDGTPSIKWKIIPNTVALVRYKYVAGQLASASMKFKKKAGAQDQAIIISSIQSGHVRDSRIDLIEIRFNRTGRPNVYINVDGVDLIHELSWATHLPKHLQFPQNPQGLFWGRPFAGLPSVEQQGITKSFIRQVRIVNDEGTTPELSALLRSGSILRFGRTEASNRCDNNIILKSNSKFSINFVTYDTYNRNLNVKLTSLELSVQSGCLMTSGTGLDLHQGAKLSFDRLGLQYPQQLAVESSLIWAEGGVLIGEISIANTQKLKQPNDAALTASVGSEIALRSINLKSTENSFEIRVGQGTAIQTSLIDTLLGLNGIIFFGSSTIEFQVSDAAFQITLHHPRVIKGISFKGNTEIVVGRGGILKQAFIKQSHSILGVAYKADTVVSFYQNGKVEAGILDDDTIIEGIPLRRGTHLEFFENGRLRIGTLASDFNIGGTDYQAGRSFVIHQYELDIDAGLDLVASKNESTRVFGWGAVTSAEKKIDPKAVDTPRGLIPSFEGKALKDNTIASCRALIEGYSVDDKLRYQRIFSPSGPDSAKQFTLATLAEFYDTDRATPHDSSNLKPASVNEELDPKTFVARLIKFGTDAAPAADLDRHIASILQKKSIDNALAAILLGKYKDVRDASRIPAVNIELLAYLSSFASDSSSTPVERVTSNAAKEAAAELTKEVESYVSITSITKGLSINPVLKRSPISDRAVEIIPQPPPLTATYPLNENTDRTWHSEAVPSPIISIRDAFIEPTEPRGSGAASYPSYSCYNGTDGLVGVCFDQINTTTTAADIGGLPVYQFGVQHRAWMTSGNGSGEPNFVSRFGFRPSVETNWVAVRWKSNAGRPGSISCSSGCLNAQPIAVEPSTNWAIYAVLPDHLLELEITFVGAVSYQPSTERPYLSRHGFYKATPYLSYAELFEFNTSNARTFADMTLPLITSRGGRTPLLTYVANLQKALADGGWLNQENTDAAKTSAETLANLSLLRHASDLNLNAPYIRPDPGDALNTKELWHQRQEALKFALPVIAYRLFNTQSRNLESQLLLSIPALRGISSVREKLSGALASFDTLTKDYVESVLIKASKEIEKSGEAAADKPDDIIFSDLDHLGAALMGAKEVISNLEEELLVAQEFRCGVLRRFQSDGVRSMFVMKSNPAVLQICEE